MAEQAPSFLERARQRTQQIMSEGAPSAQPPKEPTTPLAQRGKEKVQQVLEDKFADPRVLKPSGEPKDISVGQMFSEAYQNAPRSGYEAARAVVEPFLSPVETAKNIGALGKGVYSKALGYMGVEQDAAQKAKDEAMANALGEFYANRYGSVAGAKQAFAKDPFGVLLDLSVPLTGGEMALARAPGILGKVGKVSAVGAKITDPTRMLPAAVGVAAKIPGVKPVVEGVKNLPVSAWEKRAGVVPGTLSTAFEAGRRPSAETEPFVQQMRGTAARTDVVSYINDAISAQEAADKASFLRGRAGALANRAPVGYQNIDSALNNSVNTVLHQNVVLHPRAFDALQAIKGKIDEFKNNNLNSLEDLDALKRSIDGLYVTHGGDTQSNRVITEMKNAVKNTIGAQSPDYLKIMDEAEANRNAIEALQYAGGREGAVPEKQLRKIITGMKDQDKLAIIERLAQSDPRIDAALKGISASPSGPKMSLSDVLFTILGYSGGGHFGALAGLGVGVLSEKPRLLGELGYRTGQVAGAAEKVAAKPYVKPVVEVGKTIAPAARPFIQELGKYEQRKQAQKQKEKFIEPFQVTVPVGIQPPQQADGGRVARADGGRIDIDAGVRALMNAAENAKKSISKSTENLLKQPDEHIAQALNVAKRHI